MGRDNNNAGIHSQPKGYKYSTDSVDPGDKYANIIVESHVTKPAPKNNKINKNARATVKKR